MGYIMKKIILLILVILFFFPIFAFSGTSVSDESLEKIRGMKALTIICRWESDNTWVNYTTSKKIKGTILGAWTKPGFPDDTGTYPTAYDCDIKTQGTTGIDLFGDALDARSATLSEYAEPLLASGNPGFIAHKDYVTIVMSGNTANSAIATITIWFVGEYSSN